MYLHVSHVFKDFLYLGSTTGDSVNSKITMTTNQKIKSMGLNKLQKGPLLPYQGNNLGEGEVWLKMCTVVHEYLVSGTVVEASQLKFSM